MLKRFGNKKPSAKKSTPADPSVASSSSSSSPKAMNRSVATSDAISTLSSLASPSRRRLKFKPTIQIREYVDEKDASDKALMFYTIEEYDKIEASNTTMVEMMIQRKNSPQKNKKTLKLSQIEKRLGDTGRGLEKMTPEEWDRTQDRREAALVAVFREQARQQRQMGRVYDPHAISRAYERATASSKDEASDVARVDERFVSKEFGPLEPSGTRLTTPQNGNDCGDASACLSTWNSENTNKSSMKKQTFMPDTRRKHQQEDRKSAKPDPI